MNTSTSKVLNVNQSDGNVVYKIVVEMVTCTTWEEPQHLLFQLANTCFFISYLAPNNNYGILFLHGVLIVGFLLFSTWAWNIICAPDIFSWNFGFMIINMGQMLYVLYQMRPVRFTKDLEEVYESLFQPLRFPRLKFKKLIDLEYAQILTLHTGEAYAMQDLTRTDRLGLIISGKANVISNHHFLHYIYPKQFLDSPEFESSSIGAEARFKVTIVASSTCTYIFWQRQLLEYLFVKDPYICTVMTTLIARDITTKLYSLNEKIVTEKGSHLDIRLPSITSSLTSAPPSARDDNSGAPFLHKHHRSSSSTTQHNKSSTDKTSEADSVFGSKEFIVSASPESKHLSSGHHEYGFHPTFTPPYNPPKSHRHY